MPLYQSNYLGRSFQVTTADYGNFPEMSSIILGNELISFPANFNPTALGSATPQDFADSLAAQMNTFFTAKFGAGNFTPLVVTHSTVALDEVFTFSDFSINDHFVVTESDMALLGGYDAGAGLTAFEYGAFDITEPAVNAEGERFIDMLLNIPKDYNLDILNRGRNAASL